ncbi:MAG: putative ABC transport system permease protein [Rhodothermales bacterium]|jgi:putative ABC transport system permease protein
MTPADRTGAAGPPRLAVWMLAASLHPYDHDPVMGDLEEGFAHRQLRSRREANRWYWAQAACSIPRFLSSSILWTVVMYANYLRLALRNLRKHKLNGAINIAGLSLGLSLCILILLFVRDELTFDRFHEQHQSLFQVQQHTFDAQGKLEDWNSNGPLPLGPDILAKVPGVEAVTRLWEESTFIRSGREVFEENALYVDPSFLSMFSFPLSEGDPGQALIRDGVVLSREAAGRLFPGQNALGQVIEVRLANIYETYRVTGVAVKIPANSSIRFDVLLPIDPWIQARYPDRVDSYNMSLVETYLLASADADRVALATGLERFYAEVRSDVLARLRERNDYAPGVNPATFGLLPMAAVHLQSASDPLYSYLLSALALGILLIACINFMTMSIGRSIARSTEVGIRKVVGAVRGQLMTQFWGEAVLIVAISMALGVVGAWAALPWFNELTDKSLSINLMAHWSIPAVILGLTLVTGLIAGSYPALVLSAFKPVDVLKSRLRVSGANWFTRSLVVLQFAMSVFLIIGTLVMKSQTDYLGDRELGFDSDRVVLVELNGLDGPMVASHFRQALASSPHVGGVTVAASALGYRGSSGRRYEHEGITYTVDMLSIDHDFLREMGVELTAGRDFDAARSTDSTGAVIVNQALVNAFGLESPLGTEIPGIAGTEIIGVTKDFNFQSLYQDVGPIMMAVEDYWGYSYLYVRLNAGSVSNAMEDLARTWGEVTADVPFLFEFLDDRMAKVYASDVRWQRIINVASVCAIFLALLGLFGLTAITVRGRLKELGIRKVLGASAPGLVTLVARDFLVLIAIGAAIAIPAAWIAVDHWLSGFAYHVSIGPAAFLVAIGLVLVAGMAAVVFQSLTAVMVDPVQTLRSE